MCQAASGSISAPEAMSGLSRLAACPVEKIDLIVRAQGVLLPRVQYRHHGGNNASRSIDCITGNDATCTGSLTGGNTTVEREPDEGVSETRATAVTLTREEQEFVRILRADNRQRRADSRLHPVLQRVARERARDMARRRYFSHTNPDGDGPNVLLKRAGYQLPSWWGRPAMLITSSHQRGRTTARAGV